LIPQNLNFGIRLFHFGWAPKNQLPKPDKTQKFHVFTKQISKNLGFFPWKPQTSSQNPKTEALNLNFSMCGPQTLNLNPKTEALNLHFFTWEPQALNLDQNLRFSGISYILGRPWGALGRLPQ